MSKKPPTSANENTTANDKSRAGVDTEANTSSVVDKTGDEVTSAPSSKFRILKYAPQVI